MSESWRTRLSRRRLELGLDGKEYDYIQSYIEHYCKESDKRCKDIDMLKTVDQVINSMQDPEFDKFTSGVLADVSARLGRDDIANKLRKKKAKPETEENTQIEETPIPA